MWKGFISSTPAALLLLFLLPGAYPSDPDQSQAGYIGSQACGECHTDNHFLWSQSLHSRMIQKVDPEKVLGDFKIRNTLKYEGWQFRMTSEEGRLVIHESSPSGEKTVYPVDYTLGSKRIQHYLSTRPDGRIRVTFPTWDVAQKKWFHSKEIIPTGDVPEVSIQIWNQHCYNCHVSQEVQGFNIETNTYQTRFTEPAINCEMCHGPGSVHAGRMKKDKNDPNRAIVHPGKLPPDRQMLVCVQCHTPRIIVQNGFNPSKNYYDYYLPTQMHFYIERAYDPPVWADGRMRRFATEGAALWQSRCYLEGGATCITCHNPHLNTIARDSRFREGDKLCLQCHESFEDKAGVAAHTHHAEDSTGSRCVSCHMPPITNMLTDHERDHTISIPVPETTAEFQIPNACNLCHKDQSPKWTQTFMDQWYPRRPKGNLKRARAFTLAAKRDPASVDLLIPLLQDTSENRVVRGSAAGFLGEYQGDRVGKALVEALKDPDVMVRAEAARSLSEVHSREAVEPLKVLLSDPNLVVRLNAFFAFIKMGILDMEGADREVFERVEAEYMKFLESFPDVYDIRVNLATYHAVHGRYIQALQEYQNARKVHPLKPLAYYYLGVTYAQLGLYDEALKKFEEALEIEPDFRNTSELIRQVKEVMQP